MSLSHRFHEGSLAESTDPRKVEPPTGYNYKWTDPQTFVRILDDSASHTRGFWQASKSYWPHGPSGSQPYYHYP